MQGQRVVLVVDGAVDGSELRACLHESGFEAVEAPDVEAALARARERTPDAVLLDLEAHGDGFGALARLQEDPELAHVPVVVVTTRSEAEHAAHVLHNGAHDYLRKPVAEPELVARLAAAMRAKAREDALRATAEAWGAMAAIDPLTGIFNRRALTDELERQVARARRYGRPLSLLMLDVDGLAAVNARHGEEVGDEVLAICGKRLRQRARAADVVGRWGGDQFMVIAPDIDRVGAGVLAEALRAVVARPSVIVEGRRIPVTGSVGRVEWAGEDADHLLARCASALADARAR